jgi:hypothetical protein
VWIRELTKHIRVRTKDARTAEMLAEMRRMFAGRPHNGERLLTLSAERNANPRAAAPGTPRIPAGAGKRAGLFGLIRLAAVVGVLLWPLTARAGIVTINFPDDVAPGTTTSNGNATADGFRISPSGEYTLVTSGGGPGIIAHGIGWDSDGPPNPAYLGPMKISTASLFVDDNGMPFSLMSARFVAAGFDANFEMVSSNGGTLDIPAGLVGAFDASFVPGLPEWTDITWLTFGYFDAGVPTAGLEQLVFAVDEPETFGALAIGLLLFSAMLLHRRRARIRRAL